MAVADVNAVVTSVLDVLPVTRSAIIAIREVLAADRSLCTELGRWEIQNQFFEEWRLIWRHGSRQDTRFEAHAKEHPSLARRILRTIATLTQALTDPTSLERHYGFERTEMCRQVEEDVSFFRFDDLSCDIMDTFRLRAQANIKYIEKCCYVMRKGNPKFDALVDLMKESNLSFRHNSPPLEAGMIVRSDLDPLRSLSLVELERLSKGAAWEAKHTDEPAESERYRDLGLAASFLAVIKYKEAKPVYMFSMRDIHLDESYEVGKHETMALLFDYPVKNEKRVVLIEWFKDGMKPERREEIHNLALLLATSKPRTTLLAHCYGVIEDASYGSAGLVLTPPPHIRSGLPKVLPSGTISACRMPISLRDVIMRKDVTRMDAIDLGIRFKIAQRLLDAAHVMHSTDWFHKNFRLESIIFFPSRERSKGGTWGPSRTQPQAYALDEPLLVGFNRIAPRGSTAGARSEWMPGAPGDNRTKYTLQLATASAVDAYSHPARVLDPLCPYTAHHDLYSLGVCLLQIGYWNTLDRLLDASELRPASDPYRLSAILVGFAQRMDGMVGSVYAGVTTELLELGSVMGGGGGRDVLKIETRLAATLGGCAA